MSARIKLNLIGITYNQVESGVYAVILEEEEGNRRLPIIIGSAEAQSIECRLQNIITPRPLTHDLMVNIMRGFGLALEEIELRRLPTGIFAADMTMSDGERKVVIDSRSSDAIGIAIRMGAPIYTSEEVMAEAGVSPENTPTVSPSESGKLAERGSNELEKLTILDLQKAMEKAVEEENYEEASRIKQEIERRKK